MILRFNDLFKKYNMNISGVIHIGAHYGEEISDYVEVGIGNIVLFEPLIENFNILTKNISNLNANIEAYCIALGNKTERVKMFLSNNELQSSSILKPKKHLELHPEVHFYGMEEVGMKKLDDFSFTKYNFMNLDVQGYELEVLRGAQNTLKNIDYIYCEVNKDEIYEGNAHINQIDEYLSEYNMKRMETSWWYDCDWGDALYVKQ